ncbi:MAG: right-handed parallel beta-helix repeat-containing protein, partial [Thermoplasmatales archaeon]|nr:right-handed parallel beta-helix repeat-containing protein [Thermoplasmatales archaeon]
MQYRKEFNVRCRLVTKFFSSQIVTVILLISFLMVTPVSEADSGQTTYYVKDDYQTIQDAIDVATDGDTIIVEYDTYYENVYVDKKLTIIGVGNPEVNANGSYYAFELRTDGITLEGFLVTNSGIGGNKAGIRVTSNNNIIRNITASGNKENGILIYKGSNNNMVSENTVSNSKYGIHLESSSDNKIIDNVLTNNDDGIHIVSSFNNIIEENAPSNNNYYGIHLRFSNNNGITENEVTNSIVGIYLWNSNENVVKDNIVSSNSLHGMDIRNSISNTIYNNRLLNSKNAYDNGNNNWNAVKTKGTNILGGSYIAGNYWSDFSGSDLNFDGIIDSVNYISGGSSRDNYPLCSHENYAPYLPNVPAPSNEATNVDKNSDLNWECNDPDWGDVLTYDVYFGTTSPPSKIESNQSGTSYDLEIMDGSTTYYWQILACDNQNHT